jgi:hypothetical protein
MRLSAPALCSSPLWCRPSKAASPTSPSIPAVRFWFRPYWTSASLPNGTGPGAEATLLELFVLGDNDVITAWSMRFSADGSALILSRGETESLRADLAWPAGEWHCLAFNYGPTETALFVDGMLIANGSGVLSVQPASAGLVVGSTAFGSGPAEGEYDEICAFARPLREFETAFYALTFSAMAARGPISAEEEAAWKEAAEKRKADQEAMMEMMRAQPTGGTIICPTNGAVFITNIVATVITNDGMRVTFDILGGTNGVLYDIFSATNLLGSHITNSTWQWQGQGYTCNSYLLTNQPNTSTFYVLGVPLDSDYDGLTDAYERLVSKTNPLSQDTDGDGLPDGWEVAYGYNPNNASDGAADADGDGISNAQEYLNEQAMLRPREPLGPCSRRTPLVISEIMYNPAPGGNEFVEIYNSHHLPQKLDGFYFFDVDDGVTNFVFGSGVTLAPRSFIVFTPTNGLDNGGDRMQLRNAQGAVLLDVRYSDEAPWPKEADGAGHSLVLARPSFGENDPRAWAASEWRGGSPGFAETNTFDPLRYIRINEFLANPAGGARDFIELYNASPLPIDISGCVLACTNSFNNAFVIPFGTIVPAHGFISWTDQQSGIGLSMNGEAIYLAGPGTNRVLDALAFVAQANGISAGRFPDGAPGFQEMSAQTAGTNNAPPLTRNIVINEIMFNPISRTNRDEYVEFYNRGTNAVPLDNWRFAGGITFTIPTNTTLAPDHYLVIAKNTNALLARYPAGQLVLAGC